MSELPNAALRGSQAHTPDLDWSQVRETVLMLQLAAAQVEAAMRDSNTSVEVLTDTFTSMAGTLEGIGTTLREVQETGDVETLTTRVGSDTAEVANKVQQSIIAFQFYDKLAQRLNHVCRGLGELSGLVGDQARLFNPQSWAALQDMIRGKYTMREERDMFDAVMAGTPVDTAIESYMATRRQEMQADSGDIELF